jgi:hypothetical protein
LSAEFDKKQATSMELAHQNKVEYNKVVEEKKSAQDLSETLKRYIEAVNYKLLSVQNENKIQSHFPLNIIHARDYFPKLTADNALSTAGMSFNMNDNEKQWALSFWLRINLQSLRDGIDFSFLYIDKALPEIPRQNNNGNKDRPRIKATASISSFTKGQQTPLLEFRLFKSKNSSSLPIYGVKDQSDFHSLGEISDRGEAFVHVLITSHILQDGTTFKIIIDGIQKEVVLKTDYTGAYQVNFFPIASGLVKLDFIRMLSFSEIITQAIYNEFHVIGLQTKPKEIYLPA